MENDYRPMPELDYYDGRDLDEEAYSDISQADRRAAEEEMRRRDRGKLLEHHLIRRII